MLLDSLIDLVAHLWKIKEKRVTKWHLSPTVLKFFVYHIDDIEQKRFVSAAWCMLAQQDTTNLHYIAKQNLTFKIITRTSNITMWTFLVLCNVLCNMAWLSDRANLCFSSDCLSFERLSGTWWGNLALLGDTVVFFVCRWFWNMVHEHIFTYYNTILAKTNIFYNTDCCLLLQETHTEC